MMDVDGVLAVFNTNYIAVLNQVSGKTVIVEPTWQPPQWNYEELLGFTKAEVRKAWEYIRQPENEFWFGLSWYTHSHEAMRQLHRLRRTQWGEIYYITTRVGTTAQHQTQMWLNALGEPYPAVIVSANKGPLCAQIGITHAIDDKDQNCLDIKSAVPGARVALLAQPWNTELQANPGEIEVCHDLVAWLKELRNNAGV